MNTHPQEKYTAKEYTAMNDGLGMILGCTASLPGGGCCCLPAYGVARRDGGADFGAAVCQMHAGKRLWKELSR